MASDIDILSYTKKDFDEIYNELIELGDELSYKWKPSQTNESDPGIVLIKENAIIGDKLNYNIDKNILEAFPSSVTQIGIARQLFEEQLACPPNWYVAAEGKVNIKYIGEQISSSNFPDEEIDQSKLSAIVPQFTKISDAEGEIAYTIVSANKNIKFDSSYEEEGYQVLQGYPVEYKYGTETYIPAEGVNYQNRLYLDDYNVAQNGIFIYNKGGKHANERWERVTLLSTQEYGKRCYRFGVDKQENVYVEFPTWYPDIFEDGIKLTYIVTDGVEGSVSKQALTQFASGFELTPKLSNLDGDGYEFNAVPMNTENVFLTNLYAIGNGKNPDTIDQMYQNWKKTAGTYNTLVTLRDYSNKVSTSELVGNGFVTDRTNDLQSAYTLLRSDEKQIRKTWKQEESISKREVIDAYALKFSVFHTKSAITSVQDYKTTFQVVDNFIEEEIKGEKFKTKIDPLLLEGHDGSIYAEIEKNKCISHDYTPLERYKPIMFKAYFPVECAIMPISKLTDTQVRELKNNIISALYNLLRSDSVSFGEEVDYDKVYDTILQADKRIKAVSLKDIKYTVSVVYRGNRGFTQENKYDIIKIDDDIIELELNGFKDSLSQELQDINVMLVKGTPGQNLTTLDGDTILKNRAEFEKRLIYKEYLSDNYYYLERDEGNSYNFKEIDKFSYKESFAPSGEAKKYCYNFPMKNYIATDIYAKSILAGKTPLFIKDTSIERSIVQSFVKGNGASSESELYAADAITTEVKMYLRNGKPYKIKANENIQIFEPMRVDNQSYGAGGKFQYKVNETIPANTSHVLASGEHVIVFWRGGETDEDDQPYKYRYYGQGQTIRCSFELNKDYSALPLNSILYDNIVNMSGDDTLRTGYCKDGQRTCGPDIAEYLDLHTKWSSVISKSDKNAPLHGYIDKDKEAIKYSDNSAYIKVSVVTDTELTPSPKKLHNFIRDCFKYEYNTISIMGDLSQQIESELEINVGKKYKYFWILNSVTFNTADGERVCRLFDNGEMEYILQNGEVFYYYNTDGTGYGQWGAGTRIIRSGWDGPFECKYLSYDDFMNMTENGMETYWISPVSGENKLLTGKEQEITSFGEGVTVQVQYPAGESITDFVLDNTPREFNGIKFFYNDDEDEGDLQQFNVSNSARIKSALLLNTNNSVSQKIVSDTASSTNSYAKQSIKYLPTNRTVDNNFFEINATYILTDRECEIMGENVDVRLVNLENDIRPLYIYPYDDGKIIRLSNSSSEENTSIYSNLLGGITFNSDGNNNSYITFNVQSGNYILPFRYVGGDETDYITLSYKTSGAIADITGETKFEDKNRTYYLEINANEMRSSDGKIKLTIEKKQGNAQGNFDASFIFEQLFKYDVPEPLKQDSEYTYNGKSYNWYMVLQRIRELDPDGQFDYSYEPNSLELIEDPLDPISFLNENHIMNPFTICQMDVDKMTIDNKVMATIRILNNVK